MSDISEEEVARVVTGPDTPIELDSDIELHEQWERPFFDGLPTALRRFVHPQVSLEGLAGLSTEQGRRWVDFVVAAPWRPAARVVEIDGAGHERARGVDRERDKLLDTAGLMVLRYDGREAADTDGKLHQSLHEMWERRPATDEDPTLSRLVIGPAALHRFAFALVEATERGVLAAAADEWVIEVDDPLGVVAAVGGHMLDTLGAVADVWGLDIVPDTVVIAGRAWRRDPQSGRWTPAGEIQPTRAPDLHVVYEHYSAPHAALPDRSQAPTVLFRPIGVPIDLAWTEPTATERRDTAADGLDRGLDVLVNDIFGHDDFRPGQLDSVRQVLGGADCLVLLPTGAGKSLVYQLAGLLRPGVTLVIDPIVSLIDDQARGLRKNGIDRVEPMHRASLDGQVQEVFRRLATGQVLFGLCTPERFQTQRFRDHLAQAAEHHLVNLAVVDEAHCVSEWGHDFRTAYLRLGRNFRNHAADDRGRPPVLLALTGTASPAVLRDVLRELEIDASAEGAVQRPANFDRPNLHYRVIQHNARQPQLNDIIRTLIPEALEVPVEDLARLRAGDTRSGIVFCPHVNGRWGIVQVAEQVGKLLGAPELIDIYGGQPKTWGGPPGSWDEHRATVARRFSDNELVALVATKAFGMGIDKPNIAWTVHVGFPSSIEAFAQEAGRAGRSGGTAVCVLDAYPPTPTQAATLLDLEVDAATRRQRYSKNPGDDDLARQMFFLTNSFPDEATEIARAVDMWRELRSAGAAPMAFVSVPIGADDREKALYRLVLAGVVHDYTIDFGARTMTIELAAYDTASIDAAVLDYATRVEPGRFSTHERQIGEAPNDIDARIEHHLRIIVQILYRVIEPARVYALREMFRLASGPDDDAATRATINAYLADGPLSTVLAEALEQPIPDIPQLLARLDTVPPNDPYEWAAAAARQIESFGRHPALLVTSTLGQAWLPNGSADTFLQDATATFTLAAEYGVPVDDAVALFEWMRSTLTNLYGGRRTPWVPLLWIAWGKSAYPPDALHRMERTVIAGGVNGAFEPLELEVVAGWKIQRIAATAADLATRIANLEKTPWPTPNPTSTS